MRHLAAVLELVGGLFLLLHGTAHGEHDRAPPTPLRVGLPRAREELSFLEGHRRYSLQGLRPGTGYEVKVAYPASIPAAVDISFTGPDTEGGAGHKTRRLLNVEKLVFATDGDGRVQGGGGGDPEVLVQIRSTGVYTNGDAGRPSHLLYDIALGEVYFGALPAETVPIVAAGLLCLALVAYLASPWARLVERCVVGLTPQAGSTKTA